MATTKLWRRLSAAVLSTALLASVASPAGAATTTAALSSDVYQAVNPVTGASLQGFTETKGAVFKASTKFASGLQPVYRLKKNNDLIWIANPAGVGEYETAQSKLGYKPVKIDFYASVTKLAGTVPVYGYLKDSMHRTAVTDAERNTLTGAGWVSEGVRFWVAPTAETTPAPTPTVPSPTPTTPAPAPSLGVAAGPVKALTAKAAPTAVKLTWAHADITGNLSKYSITATDGQGYTRTFLSKDTTVTFAGLQSGTAYRFEVITEAVSLDGKSKATASAAVSAVTGVATPALPPTPTPVPSPIPTPAPPADPTNWVRWETIAQPGQDLNTVLANPALTGKILKLPAGVFEISDFRDVSAAMRVPKTVKGLIGSGKDTIIRLKPFSSTFAWSVPTQAQGGTNQLHIIRMNNGVEPQVFSDVWIQGTEQGHNYNGMMIGQAKPGTVIERVLVTGIPGNDGTPPGETHGIGWWQSPGGVTRDIEVDGYRWIGDTFKDRVKGAKVGAAPIGWNSSDNAKAYNVYTHDSLRSMPTFWQSNNAETWNLQSINNDAGINHEESFGIVHHQPVIYGTSNHQHIGFMSQQSDGKLTIIGATVDTWMGVGKEPGPIAKGAKMLILSPTKNYGTAGGKIVTRPTAVLDDGVTPHPFTWANG
jgi:hypothetical protein